MSRLTTPQAPSAMREAMLRGIHARGWSKYRFAMELKNEATIGFIYTYLRGESETSTAIAEKMLKVLDLVIVPRTPTARG